jgi:hypothetical protein
MLRDDPARSLATLLAVRDPVYASADLTVCSRDVPHDIIVDEVMDALAAFLQQAPRVQPGPAR